MAALAGLFYLSVAGVNHKFFLYCLRLRRGQVIVSPYIMAYTYMLYPVRLGWQYGRVLACYLLCEAYDTSI